MDALIIAFTGVTNQGQRGPGIHLDALHRAGRHADGTPIAAVLVDLDPILPGQGVVGAGRDTFVVFAGQAHPDGRHFGPVRRHIDAGSFGGVFTIMGPRADGHANLTFSAKRAF